MGVIHLGWRFGVDHLNQVAVGREGVVLFVDGDGAIELAVYRVAAQQTGALDQVIGRAFTHNNGAQTQAVAATGFLDQDARQQTADTTEAIQHHVSAFTGFAVLLAGYFHQFIFGELLDATALAFNLELADHLAQVNRGSTQLELAHGLEHLEGVVHRQLAVTGQAVTGEAMGLENVDHRTVDQTTAVDRGDHVVVTVELANHRNHRFRKGFSIDPLTETLVGLLSHGQYLPHVGAEKRGYIMTAHACLSNARLS